jgi:hypothetical protein
MSTEVFAGLKTAPGTTPFRRPLPVDAITSTRAALGVDTVQASHITAERRRRRHS